VFVGVLADKAGRKRMASEYGSYVPLTDELKATEPWKPRSTLRLGSGSTPQTSGSIPRGRPGFSRTLLVVIVIAVIAVGVVAVFATFLFLGPTVSVSTKNFTPYSTPPPKSSDTTKELTVIDTNGDVNLWGWSQSYILINGTVTARGFGANPDAIAFIKSNSSGDIIFQAVFPASGPFLSPSYTVDINVYVPSSPNLPTVMALTVNGSLLAHSVTASSDEAFYVTNGKLSVSEVNTTDLTLTNTNGDIDLSCTCYSVHATTTNGAITANLPSLSYTGTYTLTSTNGNVDLEVPAAGSYTITASTTNGSVSSTGLAVQLTNHVATTIGAGTATVIATSTNGSIAVTGI
jgi:putative adhesin